MNRYEKRHKTSVIVQVVDRKRELMPFVHRLEGTAVEMEKGKLGALRARVCMAGDAVCAYGSTAR